MKTKTKDFHIYLPVAVATKIEKRAAVECRSVNQQIIYWLLRALKAKAVKE